MANGKLTAKQEAFAQSVAVGMTQADAYRAAYSAGNMKDQVIQNKASLMMKGYVGVRVEKLRAELADKCLWSREDSVQELAEIVRGRESRAAEKVAAIKELNIMHGFNAPIKVNIDGEMIHKIERLIVRPTNKNT
jgi:hypothetical protein